MNSLNAFTRKVLLIAGLASIVIGSFSALAQSPVQPIDAMRGITAIDQEAHPPIMFPTENNDIRRQRSSPFQPPTIPHHIDGYQVDKNFNKCLSCHARSKSEQANAIPISVTHYIGRDGIALASISPRRYFCTQCHVAQAATKPLVENTFVDVDTLLKLNAAKKPIGK